MNTPLLREAAAVAALALLAASGCRGDRSGKSAAGSSDPFVERAKEVGLDFVHDAGRTGKFYFPEIQGAGAAFIDYDNDGDLDVFVLQGGSLEAPGRSADGSKPAIGRLYRNDLVVNPDGTRVLHFTDVTEQSGIRTHGYGQGVAVGDYDNDGWPDLFVTELGATEMWHNNGNGTFTETTMQTGTESPYWNTSATFFDFDRDGWLDLYVTTYTDFKLATHKRCSTATGRQEYCGPLSYRGQPDRLFHNRGDGTFEDVSRAAGILTENGPGLGVIAVDADGDGWPDVYVANDEAPNVLWHNQRDGTFKNIAVLAGCAVDRNGHPHSGMGVDAGDYDNDGDEDLFVTNMEGEYNTLYQNDGHGLFEDRTIETGLATTSIPYTAFGTAFLDYDNDGWLDLLVVNGAVKEQEALVRAQDPFPYHQNNQLFHNKRDGTFEDVTARAGKAFELSEVGRGAAFGDVDNDGDTDVLISNDDGPVRLLINQVGQSKHWIGLRLLGSREKRDMLGAKVTVLRPDGPPLLRHAHTDGSYESANDPRVLVGLGDGSKVNAVRVTWPDGKTEEWQDPAIDRYSTLVEGGGRPVRGTE